MFSLKKLKSRKPKQIKPGNIELPDNLLRKIEAHQQAFMQQVQQLSAQTRRDIEILVDGYVSSLDLPDDAQLSYNHETKTLTWDETKPQTAETAASDE